MGELNNQEVTIVDYQHTQDIPDATFIAACRLVMDIRGLHSIGASRWDVANVLAGNQHLVAVERTTTDEEYNAKYGPQPGVPAKIVLAKARRLIKRGLLDGCTCGCRGDFLPTEATPPFIDSEKWQAAVTADPWPERDIAPHIAAMQQDISALAALTRSRWDRN